MNQSGAGVWWSLWVPSSSDTLWFDAQRANGGLREGSLGEVFSPHPLPWSLLWRLWDCPGYCECSVCAVCARWAGAVLGTQHVPGPQGQLHLNYTALPLKGAIRAGMCCCTWLHFKQIHELLVSGCKALHSINALGCTKLSMNTLSTQIYTLAEEITVTYFTGLLTCRLDQNLAARSWKPE